MPASVSHERVRGEQPSAERGVVAVLVADMGPDGDEQEPWGLRGTSSGKPLAAWSVEALARVDAVRLVLAAVPHGVRAPEGSVGFKPGRDLVTTLEAALDVAGPCETVVLHDPRRPLAAPDLFLRVLLDLREHGCGAVVAATPVTDTLKRRDGRGRIVETVDRSRIWEVQTPQAYRLEGLRAALARARAVHVPIGHALLPTYVPGRVRVVGLPRESLRVQRPAEARVVERLLRHPP